jgi:hypothetical protein
MDRKRQAETIAKALRDVPMEKDELPSFLMMWVEDMTYDRAAICEAEKLIRKERGWH